MNIKEIILNIKKEKFNKMLYEMAIGVPGEYDIGTNLINIIKDSFNEYIKNDNKILIGNLKVSNLNINLYLNDDIFYIVLDDNTLIGYLIIKTKQHIPNHIKNIYVNISCIHNIYIEPKYRRMGVSKKIYEYILSLDISIMGDEIQYENARKLWLSMNKVENYKLDVIDLQKDKIIEEDIKLKDIYDGRIWIHMPKNYDNKMSSAFIKLHYNWLFTRLIISNRNKFI